MSESHSPPPTAADIGLLLRARPTRHTWQVSGWPDTFSDAAAPLLEQLHVAAMPDTRSARVLPDGGRLLRTAPERLWLYDVGPATAEVARHHGVGTALVAVDLSHAEISFVVAGRCARELMTRLVAIDVDARAFPARAFAQTALGQAPCRILCDSTDRGGQYVISVPRSYTQNTLETIRFSATTLGCTIEIEP